MFGRVFPSASTDWAPNKTRPHINAQRPCGKGRRKHRKWMRLMEFLLSDIGLRNSTRSRGFFGDLSIFRLRNGFPRINSVNLSGQGAPGIALVLMTERDRSCRALR